MVQHVASERSVPTRITASAEASLPSRIAPGFDEIVIPIAPAHLF